MLEQHLALASLHAVQRRASIRSPAGTGRVMRMRLRAANTGVTPERALQSLKRIQHHRVCINGAPPLCGVSSMTTEQHEVLTALKVKQPSQFTQLSLLQGHVLNSCLMKS